jgi:transposase
LTFIPRSVTPGLDPFLLRARLVAGQAEHRLLDTMLERCKARGLVKAHGKQRTDSTHVLGAVRDLHLLELVGETLRTTLDDLARIIHDGFREGNRG